MSTLDPQTAAPTPGGAHCALHTDRSAEFTCSRCGNFACGECKNPGEGGALFCKACSEHAYGDIPMERIAELGFFTALFRTVVAVLIRPWDFFAQRSRDGGLVVPILFGSLIHIPSTLAYAIVNSFGANAQLEELRNNPLFRNNPVWDNELFQLMLSPGGQLLSSFVSILLYPLFLGLFAVMEWGAMMLVGARGAGFRDYLRSLSYLQATSVVLLAMAPLSLLITLVSPQSAGLLFFPYGLYYLIWLVIALWKTGRTDLWRPVVAQVLLFFTCCCVPWIAVFVLAFGFVAANLPH